MEILPKPMIPGPPPPPLDKERKPDSQDGPTAKPGLTKAEGKSRTTEELKKKTGMVEVMVSGVEKLLPYHKFGYASDGDKKTRPEFYYV